MGRCHPVRVTLWDMSHGAMSPTSPHVSFAGVMSHMNVLYRVASNHRMSYLYRSLSAKDIISGSFAENDLRLEASYGSLPPCVSWIMVPCLIEPCLIHVTHTGNTPNMRQVQHLQPNTQVLKMRMSHVSHGRVISLCGWVLSHEVMSHMCDTRRQPIQYAPHATRNCWRCEWVMPHTNESYHVESHRFISHMCDTCR